MMTAGLLEWGGSWRFLQKLGSLLLVTGWYVFLRLGLLSWRLLGWEVRKGERAPRFSPIEAGRMTGRAFRFWTFWGVELLHL